MSWDFSSAALQQNIALAEFGAEKESLRVTPDGFLAQTKHPFTEEYIDRDFCENQVEMITGVHDNVDSLIDELEEIHRTVNAKLREMNELLWPFSNPPIVRSADDIPIALFEGEQRERTEYRRYLAEKYGKAKMLFSGIHLNYSFSAELLQAAFAQSGESDFDSFKDRAYLELIRKLLQYNWLIVYLTAASPIVDSSFARLHGIDRKDRYSYASVRCSEVGYWNDFLPLLDFTTLDSYCGSIRQYVDRGRLRSTTELYYPLRLKPRGKNSLDALRENGVNHIELRCLDVNPLSEVGLFKEDVRFIHLLILYLMSLPDRPLSKSDQRTAIENSKTAALYDDAENEIIKEGKRLPLKIAAEDVLFEIKRFTEQNAPVFLTDLDHQLKKLSDRRYVETVRERFTDYIHDGITLAEKYMSFRGSD